MKKTLPNNKKSKRSKKGLSKLKKKNIRVAKLTKQGILGKEVRKKRKKERKIQENREYYERRHKAKQEKKENEPEIEITGEDMIDMIDETDLKSIMNIYSGKNQKKRSIESFERQGRSFKEYNDLDEDSPASNKKVKKLLPVMTEEGWEARNTKLPKEQKKEKESEDQDSGISEEEEEGDEEKEKVAKPLSVAQILAERHRTLHSDKVQMACLAYNVIQDPSKMSNLRALIDLMLKKDPATEVTARKYATLTILQVFHDIIPSYRIQENKPNNTMKKEKFQAVKLEMELMGHYRKYLNSLEEVLDAFKEKPDHVGLQVLSETSLHCLGDLLVMHPRFNYGINIIQALVPYLTHSNDQFRLLTYQALSEAIKNDKGYDLTVEIVRKVYRLTHRLRFKVKSEVLRLFISIRVKEIRNQDSVAEQERTNYRDLSHKDKLIRKLSEKAHAKTSRKQKKDKKKIAKIRDSMAEINSQEIQNTKNVKHSEIVQTVFGIYFHILKKKPKSKLMSVVLEGLARFAHLINMEFFSDLLGVLGQFLENGMLGRRESLYCLHTIFIILSGQGENLNINPQRFYNQAYALLLELNSEEMYSELRTVLEIIEQMLIQRRKKVSIAKVLSFAKRLATLSLTLPHHTALPLLVTLKKVFSTFSALEALLDTDCEGSPGRFLPDIPDPEHANTCSTALWDLILAQRHYHPSVRIMAHNILHGISPREVPAVHSITQRSCEELVAAFDITKLKFNPSTPTPNEHLKSKKRKALKPLLQGDCLDLDNLRLQGVCEKVLGDEENGLSFREPPPKRSKIEDSSLLDFYTCFSLRNDPTNVDYNDSGQSAIVNEFLHPSIERK